MTYTTAQEGTSELVCSMYYPGQKKKRKEVCRLFYLSGCWKGTILGWNCILGSLDWEDVMQICL